MTRVHARALLSIERKSRTRGRPRLTILRSLIISFVTTMALNT